MGRRREGGGGVEDTYRPSSKNKARPVILSLHYSARLEN
jgi:hypothetical protein